jgi:hypothetical protein
MPIVLRVEGFAFGFYSNDHEPAHVHAFYAGTKCRIILDTLQVRNDDMKESDWARAVRIVGSHRGELHAAWTEFQDRKGGGR